jgi:hypothetical protein
LAHSAVVLFIPIRGLSRSTVAEAVIASFLSPDAQDMCEAAFTRRIDRLSGQTARLERDVRLTADTLALFVRHWLTITPPLPPEAHAAQVKGKERLEDFVQTLSMRLQQGSSFLSEIPDDVRNARRKPANDRACSISDSHDNRARCVREVAIPSASP